MISYHGSPYFRYNLLIVCGGNVCKHVIKDRMEMRGYGPSMKVKDETHHGIVKTAEPNEDPMMTVRCPFGDMVPPFLSLRFLDVGGINPSMAVGQNIPAGKKGRAATEFICEHTRILARHSIVHTHRVVNGHAQKFRSDSTLGTAHVRVNQHGAGHQDNRLDYTFSDAVLMSSTRSTKADVLLLFN